MAANVIIPGKLVHIRTTGFVTSDNLVVGAVTFIPPTAAGSISIVDRASVKVIFRTKTAANTPSSLDIPYGVNVPSGLSCTVLGTGGEAMVYLK